MDANNTNPRPVDVDDDSSSDNNVKDKIDMNQSQCPDPILKGEKRKKLNFEVWAHFTILTSKSNEELKCICKICHCIYSAQSKNRTGKLKRHIIKCQKIITKDIGQYLITSD